MPYTPPSAQSPASSKSSSPVVSRSSSYHEDVPRSPVTARPQLPRSMSSASYLHKHRRSPSITKPDEVAPIPTSVSESKSIDAVDFAMMGSIRQSPPPVNKHRMPTGAVLSPPDSSENSESDEASNRIRGRELEKSWDELQMAVRALPQQRDGSPEKSIASVLQQVSEPVSQTVSPTALSSEARKISHSRSATETKIMLKTPPFSDSPAQTSEDSDEDEEGLFTKPVLVRKKSGELVKPALRPSSRRRYSSMPGTPTYSKSVHFNDSDNQTRHFLQVDKPIAVSAGSSPVEQYDSESEFPFDGDGKTTAELGIRIAHFPSDTLERRMLPVRVDRIFLSGDRKTLVGSCTVQNISFQKLVVARFTLDYWKTTSEVAAEYSNDVRSPSIDGCDRFNFHIKLSDLANIHSKTMLLCVRYNVGGQEFWDNNADMNYQIDFTMQNVEKPGSKQTRPVQSHSLGQRPMHAIVRSRQSPPVSRHASRHGRGSMDDDFAIRFDSSATYTLDHPDSLLGESPTSIRLKPKSKRSAPTFASSPTNPSTNGLGSRYDFGTSLSAALSTAQDKLGRQSGLMNAAANGQAAGSYFGPVDRTGPSEPETPRDRPDALTTDRPAMGSDQYRDLVQKFCYFTSGPGKGPSSPLTMAKPQHIEDVRSVPQADGVSKTDSSSSSSDSSASSSPLLDGANDRSALAAFLSRSGSPVPNGRIGARSASPVSFGYPYHASSRDGYLSDAPAPTAIHG